MKEKQRYNHTMSRRGYVRIAHIMLRKQQVRQIHQLQEQRCGWKATRKKNGKPSSEAVAEKMKEIEEYAPESQNATNIVDDTISLVFGKETQGKVRRMGFGVTPSKVGTYVQQNGTIKQLQSMMHNLQQDMHEMRSIFFQNLRQQNEQEQIDSGGGSGIGNDIGRDYNVNRPKKSCNFDNVDQHQIAMQSNLENMSCGDIPENTK